MPRIPLLGGTYQARSVIANAQRCVNLYPEKNPQDSSAPVTHYLTPGTRLQSIPLSAGTGRCLYTATNGKLYYVCGQTVYYIDSNFVITALGVLLDARDTLVYAVDNGNAVVLVDGSGNGYAINLVDDSFALINDPNFLGADRVDFVDTFLVFNQPGTKNFYSSLSNVTFAELTQAGGVLSGTIVGGASGAPGVYTGVPLTGGSGTGAIATITIGGGGAVTSVVITTPGIDYLQGDVLSTSLAPLTGFTYTLADMIDVTHAFDPTWIAAKTGFPDQLATLCCVHREIWLFGIVKTTEVWYDAAGAAFPFEIMPGVFLEHGCAAKYSVCKHDLLVLWLGIDAEGLGTVYMGAGYKAQKISTPAIAIAINEYGNISDAIGMMYKQADHVFYVLTFPSADKTWVYDLTEGLWHERVWLDPETGLEHRWRPNCMALAYSKVLAADWETGNIYTVDLAVYTDDDHPIMRRRGFPHLLNDGKRMTYDRFVADMECGNGIEGGTDDLAPKVNLRWSDTRGRSYGDPMEQTLGERGAFLTQPQWRQLGMARDRVFELYWSDATRTALNGAWIDVTPAMT